MAPAPKKRPVPPAVTAATPVEAAVATVSAVMKSEPQLDAAPAAEVQQSFRNALEKSVIESRAAFAKAKTAADEAASAFEVSFAAAKDGAVAINTKAFEALRANADANFDFLKAVFAVKSLPDLIALQSEFARKQVETLAARARTSARSLKRRWRTPSSRSRNKWRNPSRSRSDLGFAFWRRVSSPRRRWTPSAVAGGVLLFIRRACDRSPQRKPCAAWAFSLVIRPTRVGPP